MSVESAKKLSVLFSICCSAWYSQHPVQHRMPKHSRPAYKVKLSQGMFITHRAGHPRPVRRMQQRLLLADRKLVHNPCDILPSLGAFRSRLVAHYKPCGKHPHRLFAGLAGRIRHIPHVNLVAWIPHCYFCWQLQHRHELHMALSVPFSQITDIQDRAQTIPRLFEKICLP